MFCKKKTEQFSLAVNKKSTVPNIAVALYYIIIIIIIEILIYY